MIEVIAYLTFLDWIGFICLFTALYLMIIR